MTRNNLKRRTYTFVAGLILCLSSLGADTARQRIIQALRSGDPRGAEKLSAAELRTAQPTAALWTLNGVAHLQLHENGAALASFRSGLKLDANYLPALEGAAQVLYSQSSQEAVPLLKRILRQKSGDSTSHAMLAALAYHRGDCATALTEFSQAGSLIDSQNAALGQQGTCYLKLHRPENAIAVFAKELQLDSSPKSLYALAIAQLAANRPIAARETLEPLTTGDKPDSTALNLTAQSFELQGDTANAVQTLRRAILADPDMVNNYLDIATLALVHRSEAVGVDLVSIGLTRLPRSAPLYIARGILYVNLGEYEKSDRDFETAERLDPSSVEAPVALGLRALQASDLPKAEKELRTRIARQPSNATLYYLLGETLLRRGAAPGSREFREAVDVTQKALTLNPRLETARDLLGRLCLEDGEIGKAIEQSRLAVKENPSDQSALYHLVVALRRSGNTSDLPTLTHRLTELRTAAMQREGTERRFALVEEGK